MLCWCLVIFDINKGMREICNDFQLEFHDAKMMEIFSDLGFDAKAVVASS